MSDEKICPIMSRPIHVPQFESSGGFFIGASTSLFQVLCLKEKCMAWVPECPRYTEGCNGETGDCTMEDREYLECKGGCRLI